jgi:hypothetical protein
MRTPDNKERHATLREAAAAITKLAQTPEPDRQEFCRILGECTSQWERSHSRRAAREAFPSLVKASRAMRSACKALVQLGDKERALIELALKDLSLDRSFWADDVPDVFIPAKLTSFDDCEAKAFALWDALQWSIGSGQDCLDPLPKKAGRPRGGVYLDLEWVVENLMWAADNRGGKLTLYRHNDSGTLLDALEIIRPFAPPGFIPKVLPLASIERARNNYRKKVRREAKLLREYRRNRPQEA